MIEVSYHSFIIFIPKFITFPLSVGDSDDNIDLKNLLQTGYIAGIFSESRIKASAFKINRIFLPVIVGLVNVSNKLYQSYIFRLSNLFGSDFTSKCSCMISNTVFAYVLDKYYNVIENEALFNLYKLQRKRKKSSIAIYVLFAESIPENQATGLGDDLPMWCSNGR